MPGIFREGLLQGKAAVVTGGGSGIGRRIAERFASHGAHVTLIGRRQDKLDDARQAIEATGGRAATAAVDVRDYGALATAIQRARQETGPIDIVLCGAAGNFPSAASAMSANGFKSVVDIDLLGTFNTCRAAYEHLRRPGACVLSISAGHAFTPVAYQAHVCAAKAGVDMLMKTLALEWGPEGLRCNSITPGPTDDTEGMRRLAPTPGDRERIERSIPLKRYGTKDELADLALFLCSEAAGYITGSVFVCDGGHSLARDSSLLGGAAQIQ